MAEVVDYRVERTLDELNLLVEFGLFTEKHAKEIVSRRENFEYALRRRTRTKLDFLKYIRFEVNLLESLDTYRKTVISNTSNTKKKDPDEELERKILLLQAKKLNDIIRSRSAHISSLFRKLTTTFQFDKELWIAYIEFAKSRKWNTRVSSLYWRLLRIASQDPEIWLKAAAHEVEINRAYDVARGIYLRALRHHSKCPKVWAEYFKMEVRFMEVVDQRARIVFRTLKAVKEDDSHAHESNSKRESGAEWDEDPNAGHGSSGDEDDESDHDDATDDAKLGKDDRLEAVKPIDNDDEIISGHLPKIVYKNASASLKNNSLEFRSFLIQILSFILSQDLKSNGLSILRAHIQSDLRSRQGADAGMLTEEFVNHCCDPDFIAKFQDELEDNRNSKSSSSVKKLKTRPSKSKMDILYECYESNGIEAARNLYTEFDATVKDQTLSLYVGMLQIEAWQLAKDDSRAQIDRIRALFERAIWKFGKIKPKLWYEYIQFEMKYSKSLEDLDRINQIYSKAQSTLHPAKVDRLIEKYHQIQVNNEVEYSDYSDLED